MKAPRDSEQTPELTTKEARQGGRQSTNLVVLVVALALLAVAGLALIGVRY